MIKRVLLGLLLADICVFASPTKQFDAVPAWSNAVHSDAVQELVQAYTSNVIRCEWAGEDKRIADWMPANLSFQFAVIGDSDVTNRVQKILNQTVGALPTKTRSELERYGLLVPALQWMVRMSRPSITNATEYLRRWSHPAAFTEADFDPVRLSALAKRLAPASFLLPIGVEVCKCDSNCPLGDARPVEDYPDIMPEEVYSTPFGASIVLRAPERSRVFRIEAKAHPLAPRPRKFVWAKVYGATIRPWIGQPECTPERGYAEFVLDVDKMPWRLDAIVFADYGNGRYSAPSIVSFYKCPLVKRKSEDGGVKSMEYMLKSSIVPYDLSPIWTPRQWIDDFELDSHGRITGIVRSQPGRLGWTRLSATGEYVVSTYSSGFPEVTRKLEYYVSPETGLLDYRPVGEEIKHRIGRGTYRRSGE